MAYLTWDHGGEDERNFSSMQKQKYFKTDYPKLEFVSKDAHSNE